MSCRRSSRGAAARVIPALAAVTGLLVSCAEKAGEVENAKPPQVSIPAAAPDVPAAPAPSPEPAVEGPHRHHASRLPGGLTRIGDASPDPELAADAVPVGTATARWGESGRDVSGEAPWPLLARDDVHDRGGDAIGILQEPQMALRSLPRARSGNLVDWVAALRDGAIRPRASRGGQGQMELRDQDILFTDTKSMPVVTFPHRAHTEWLSCGNCHDWLFKAKQGANDIAMADIARGQACGLCHGNVAFPATDCFRCHNGPRPQGPGRAEF